MLIGNAGNDRLDGDDGNDTLLGGDGDDLRFGDVGNMDSCNGEAGSDLDVIVGGVTTCDMPSNLEEQFVP